MTSVDLENNLSSIPGYVTQGLKLQTGFLGVDSLYLVLEYPSVDVYENWLQAIGSLDNSELFKGIVVDDFVVRRGLLGYKLSVWDGDARLLLTDRVDEAIQGTPLEGQGLGMMLQLGPKWLRVYGDVLSPDRFREYIYAQLVIFGVPEPIEYPCRINRLDIALDVIGLEVASLSVDEWNEQWVGYAAPNSTFYSSRTRMLETINIGKSSAGLRFKVYDKQVESIKNGTSDFWRSVWKLNENDDLTPVARFEWSFKCYQAKYVDMSYLTDFTFEGFMRLLNYATVKWGSLRVPQADQKNKKRWPLAPLWEEVRRLIDDWTFNFKEYAWREYDYQPDLKPSYLRSAVGWISGLMARVGLENGTVNGADLQEVFDLLESEGFSHDDISGKAANKWQVLFRLAGRRHEL